MGELSVDLGDLGRRVEYHTRRVNNDVLHPPSAEGDRGEQRRATQLSEQRLGDLLDFATQGVRVDLAPQGRLRAPPSARIGESDLCPVNLST